MHAEHDLHIKSLDKHKNMNCRGEKKKGHGLTGPICPDIDSQYLSPSVRVCGRACMWGCVHTCPRHVCAGNGKVWTATTVKNRGGPPRVLSYIASTSDNRGSAPRVSSYMASTSDKRGGAPRGFLKYTHTHIYIGFITLYIGYIWVL